MTRPSLVVLSQAAPPVAVDATGLAIGLAAGFPLLFTALWLAVGALLSELARWPALAQRFPGGPRPAGRALRGQVTGVGMVRERGVTALVPTTDGLYLYSHGLFRFRRPPVLVPWAAVRHQSEHRVLRSRTHTLALADVTTIRVSDRAWQQLAPRLASA